MAVASDTAVVVTSYPPFPVTTGGRKRNVRLAEAMERCGLRPHVLTIGDVPEEAQQETRDRGWTLETVGLPTHTLADRARLHGRQYVASHAQRMVRRLRELADTAALIQFEEIRAAQYVLGTPSHVPRIVSLHNVDSEVYAAVAGTAPTREQRLRGRYLAWRMSMVERRAARAGDAVICVSEHDRRHFAQAGARRTLLIPNGVDPELLALPAVAAPTERVLFFGGFGWEPNVDGAKRFVREVWPLIRRERPTAELRIAGTRAEERVGPAVEGVDGVRVLGFVRDLVPELACARVVVAPLWLGGGTRIKVLEALAAARPVVGTTIGVERIGFEHGMHGLVADDARGLASATIRVLADDALASRFAHNARELGRRYVWDEMTKPAEAVYRRLIGGRRALAA